MAFNKDAEYHGRTKRGDEIAFVVRDGDVFIALVDGANGVLSVQLDMPILEWMDMVIAQLMDDIEDSD